MNLSKKYILHLTLTIFLFYSIFINGQNENITVESDIFDTGKMWTFDYPPVEYFKNTYDFVPSQEWFDDVRLSALRIPGCTASFVSENGLIMTNHHCSPRHRNNVQKEGEDLAVTGFYAETLEDERKVPNMYAEQLTFLIDVTDEVNSAIDSADTDKEKIKRKENIRKKLVNKYKEETGLKCQFVTLFNGGKYSIYGYKRFEDVRLAFIPEKSVAEFGGDFDNFTYPRYDLDCAFFRVYDNDGNPLKSDNYFKFSSIGVQNDDVIFSVGNPGNTNRLNTVSQLEYNRDLSYRNRAFLLDEYYSLLAVMKTEHPEKADQFEKLRSRIGNSQKVFHYTQAGLMDPYLIARKRDFENKIKAKVNSDPDLKKNYGHVWDAISHLRNELKPIESKLAAYKHSRYFGAIYFKIAKDVIEFARQSRLPKDERMLKYKKDNLDSLKKTIFPQIIDPILENAKLQVQLDYIRLNLGNDNQLVLDLCKDLYSRNAAESVLQRSKLTTEEKLLKFLEQSPDEILSSNEPFIKFVSATADKIETLTKSSSEIRDSEDVLVNMLGKVQFELYGTEIPPDANFTLRLSDGTLERFNYNGTVAIEKTTFYGMYDRYYGSDKNYPWKLPPRWENRNLEFDLSTTYNFISTNDIVGGNSGSAVINKDAEVVGLAFDGNVHSIVGNFIFLPEDNRMVSVASQAIVESLDKIYNAERIVKELETGKILD